MPGQQNEVTFRFLAEPTDVNFGGKVHGGSVMKWIDQAAYACAAGWSASYCVTIYVGGIRFYRPVLIGQVVEVRARLIYTGTTSMHIAVDVFSRDPKASQLAQTTHCIIIFVAVDGDGQPVPVPPWEPETAQDRQMRQYALRLMELRKAIEDEMKPFITADGPTDAQHQS
jgi:acyl-CoA hydrolase